MMEEGEDVFYYLTAMNENYAQPSMPEGAEAGILKGMYRLSGPETGAGAVRLLGSGAILPEVIAAAELLAQDWGLSAEVFSVTSFSELARDAREAERRAMLDRRPRRRSATWRRCCRARHLSWRRATTSAPTRN